MGKWLAKISENFSEPQNTLLTKPTKGGSVSFVSTPTGENENLQPLLDELHQLNQRWQKADTLEQAGQFSGLRPEREERICQELRQVCGRATEIWETIREHRPDLLDGLYLLYP